MWGDWGRQPARWGGSCLQAASSWHRGTQDPGTRLLEPLQCFKAGAEVRGRQLWATGEATPLATPQPARGEGGALPPPRQGYFPSHPRFCTGILPGPARRRSGRRGVAVGVLVPSGFPHTHPIFFPHPALRTAKIRAAESGPGRCGRLPAGGARGGSPGQQHPQHRVSVLPPGSALPRGEAHPGCTPESLHGSIIPGAAAKTGAKRPSRAPGVTRALRDRGDLAAGLGGAIHPTGSGEGTGTHPSPKDRRSGVTARKDGGGDAATPTPHRSGVPRPVGLLEGGFSGKAGRWGRQGAGSTYL